MMMYFSYRDLKAKNYEIAYIYFYQEMSGSNYNVNPPPPLTLSK